MLPAGLPLGGSRLLAWRRSDAGHFFRDPFHGIIDLLAGLQGAGINAHIGEALGLVHHDLKGQGRPGGRRPSGGRDSSGPFGDVAH